MRKAIFLLLQILLMWFVPGLFPSQKHRQKSAVFAISTFLIIPALFPCFSQSGLKISNGKLLCFANFIPRLSAPLALPDKIVNSYPFFIPKKRTFFISYSSSREPEKFRPPASINLLFILL